MKALNQRQSITLEVAAQVFAIGYFVAIYPYGQLSSIDSFQPLLYGLGMGAIIGLGFILIKGREPSGESSLNYLGAFLILVIIGILRELLPLVAPILIVTPILIILITRGSNYFRIIFGYDRNEIE